VGNVSEKIGRENQNTFYVLIFFPENRAVYENVGGRSFRDRQATGDNTVWKCAALMPDT